MAPESNAGDEHFTLQDIADVTGYARSTVSLALRNHPSLPAETREKIHAAAEKMGYRPNPLVAALMTQLRCKKPCGTETIALLNLSGKPAAELSKKDLFYKQLFAGIETAAEAMGVTIDEIIATQEMSGRTMSRILTARGIHGVLLFPGRSIEETEEAPDLNPFTVVQIGFGGRTPFHRVVADYTHDIDLALKTVRDAGIKKLGFAASALRDRSADYGWSSRFLLDQARQPRSAHIPFIKKCGPEFTRDEFMTWFERYKPETILVAGTREYDWLKEAGVRIPQDCGIINLCQRENPGMAGIDPCTNEVGRAAVELLMSLLQSNRIGLPEFPRLISIQGKWIDGESFKAAGK
jgi:LacI family fructose operon transcriptional repressor